MRIFGLPRSEVPTARRQFQPLPIEVVSAREFAAAVLDLWKIESPEAIVVVGELAANAVQHGSGPFEVVLARQRHRLRIELTNGRFFFPSEEPSHDDPVDDPGLKIVAGLSAGWGAQRVRGGARVWAEIALSVPSWGTGKSETALVLKSA
jgi:hypothetical protein